MPNHYEISPTNDTLTLQNGKGSATVAVRYIGSHDVEARASAKAMEGADSAWLNIAPPHQRKMRPGQTQTFKVTVEVPPGTPPGRYGVRLDVMSVTNPDEEYDRGPLITYQVETTAKPAQQPEPKAAAPLRIHIKQEVPRWKIILGTIFSIFALAWFVFIAWQMLDMFDRFKDTSIDAPTPVIERQ